jgi:hypothetical protein
MDKILERYERYSYAEKSLISAESESEVRIMGWISIFICHIYPSSQQQAMAPDV